MAKKNDSLGDRMKGYESVSRNFLTRRVPAIIRLDGKAFHTFTKGMEKPFDPVLTQAMQETMKYLCENIQGCVLGYTQSDEITLVLTDYTTIQTDAWFGYNIQKMCSVSASMATLAFNKAFNKEVVQFFLRNDIEDAQRNGDTSDRALASAILYANYDASLKRGAMFDSRAFSVPKEEVCNCLIWRQQDATRNSIEAVGQANFSHHELHKKTCNMIQEMFSSLGFVRAIYPGILMVLISTFWVVASIVESGKVAPEANITSFTSCSSRSAATTVPYRRPRAVLQATRNPG